MSFIINIPSSLLYITAVLCSVFAWKDLRASFHIQDSYAQTYAEEYGTDSMKDTYRLMSYLRRAGVGYAIACVAFLACSLSLFGIVVSTSTSFAIIMCVGSTAMAWALFCDAKVSKLALNAVKELDDVNEKMWQGIWQDIKEEFRRRGHDRSSNA